MRGQGKRGKKELLRINYKRKGKDKGKKSIKHGRRWEERPAS